MPLLHVVPPQKSVFCGTDFGSTKARNQGRGHLGHSPLENFKTLHSNFDICRNFQRIKMKFYTLIIFRKALSEFFFVLLVNYLLTRFFVNNWHVDLPTNMLELSKRGR